MLERPCPPGRPEAVDATASIPIDSGTLYHGAGWEEGGERRVSDTEIAKLWNHVVEEDRGKVRILQVRKTYYALESLVCIL